MYKIANKLMASGRLERPSIDDVVAGLGDLPTLAPVAVEVLRLAEDEDSSLKDLVAVIRTDPSLTARLLRVANSAIYGQVREVTNLLRATTLLGLRTVKLLSLGFSLVSTLSAGPVNTTLIWRRSLAASVLAQQLVADKEKRVADDAFVTGLLGNVGILALVKVPVYTAQLPDKIPWLSAADEQTLLGYTADDVTAEVFTSWGLPESMGNAVQYRRRPNHPDCTEPELAGLLQVADAGALLLLADTEEEQAQAYNDMVFSAATHLGFTAAQLEEVMTNAGPDLDDIASLFELQSVTAVPVADIMAAAQAKIARLGMEGVGGSNQAAGPEAAVSGPEPGRLAGEAATDSRTGLANRRTLEAYLDNQINSHVRVPRPTELGLILVDVDHIKSINQAHGREIGDVVLRTVARRLTEGSRSRDMVARLAGTQFAVVASGVSRSELESSAERLRDEFVHEVVETEAGPISVMVAIGACHVKSGQLAGTQDREQIIVSAEQAMHASWQEGSNRVTVVSFGARSVPSDTDATPAAPSRPSGTGARAGGRRGGGLGARLAAAAEKGSS